MKLYPMDPSSAAIVQLRYFVYKKMHFLYVRTIHTLHSISMFIVRARRSRLSRTLVPILCHSHRAYTIRTPGIRVISYNNKIYLFNFLFMSNGNGNSIIIRPTLVTLHFITMHSLQTMFIWTFQSRQLKEKQNEPKQIRWFMNTRCIIYILLMLCQSGVYII